jgi:hypothetical protein
MRPERKYQKYISDLTDYPLLKILVPVLGHDYLQVEELDLDLTKVVQHKLHQLNHQLHHHRDRAQQFHLP